MADTVLIFTRTAGYRHASIPAAAAALRGLAALAGMSVQTTEDPAVFTRARLESCPAVVFLSTTGDVLTGAARTALERYVLGGGGFLGVHSASDTERGWPFFRELIGARFASHPPLQPGTVRVADPGHPATARLPRTWQWTDEWYDFASRPEPSWRVLATVDEDSYAGGTMGAAHPLAWCRDIGRGRSLYTALGHAAEAYADPDFRAHLLGALAWVARRGQDGPAPDA
jgi:uncharacterized protein